MHTFTLLMMIQNAIWTMRLLYSIKVFPARRIENPVEGAVDSSQTSVKSVLHIHKDESQTICHNANIPTNWYDSTSIFQDQRSDRKNDLLNLNYAHHSMITSTDTLRDTVFSPDESLQGSGNSYTVSKCWFKFSNLQIFCYFSNDKPTQGLWETIPCHVENDYIESMLGFKIKITSSRNKYLSQLFTYF